MHSCNTCSAPKHWIDCNVACMSNDWSFNMGIPRSPKPLTLTLQGKRNMRRIVEPCACVFGSTTTMRRRRRGRGSRTNKTSIRRWTTAPITSRSPNSQMTSQTTGNETHPRRRRPPRAPSISDCSPFVPVPRSNGNYNKRTLWSHMRVRPGGSTLRILTAEGSGSILETLRAQKRLVVVPNDSLMDNHQAELAEEMDRMGYLISSRVEWVLDEVSPWTNFISPLHSPVPNIELSWTPLRNGKRIRFDAVSARSGMPRGSLDSWTA